MDPRFQPPSAVASGRIVKDLRRRAINEFERIEQNLADLLGKVDVLRVPVTGWEFRQGRHVAPGRYEYDGTWQPYAPTQTWGGENGTAWFRTAVALPDSVYDLPVFVRLYPGGEAILRVNSTPVYGIDFNHREYQLTAKAEPGQSFDLELECYVRDAPDDAMRNDIRVLHQFQLAELVVKDRDLEALYYDVAAALDLALATKETRADLSARLIATLKHAIALLDPYAADPRSYRAGARAAADFLHSHLYDQGMDRSAGVLNLVGHCHIDLFYVWPYRESVRKNLRTNLTALDMIGHYDRYIFSQSQAKLFADMKRYYPDAYARVKAAAASGRFEPIGGMWVEPDGNIPCGEALVRQMLYGQKFFREEFGCRSRICWMPDLFGVAASFPQLLREAGYEVFYTNKQAIWHDTNEFPHSTFWWEGIDGSRILAHIPPTHFIGKMDPASLMQQWSEHREKQSPQLLYTYGFGDGGGGPTPRMLEYASRLARMDGLPRLQLCSVGDFVARLTASATDLPIWTDELYLEAHRGAQTSKGPLKLMNRRAEAALRNAEMLATISHILGAGSATAGTAHLELLWKELLECQFHDGVTGSHCAEAGQEIAARYQSLLNETELAAAAACAALSDSTGDAEVTLYNLAGGVTEGHVIWSGQSGEALAHGGLVHPTQLLSDGRLLSYVAGLPALGHQAARIVAHPASSAYPFALTTGGIESPHYRLLFNEAGALLSLFDKESDRETLAAPANVFALYEDKPGRFEAWDIANDYQLRPIHAVRFLGIEDGQCGPVLASKILKWKIGESDLTQEIILYTHSRRIDFVTRIDWRETRKLLRVEFPFELLARQATYEIAFGVLTRPTCPTSPYDKARFEVPFHRWLDVAEHDYGVGILNNGKYAGCVSGATASLSLLKAPRFPDPTSDIGLHDFTYSLLPHRGTWQAAGVFQQAVLLNNPIALRLGSASVARQSYCELSSPGIAVEAFKLAEDGQAYVLRLVDYFGQRRPVTVTLPRKVAKVIPCNLLEEPATGKVTPQPSGFTYTSRPFGVASFRVEFSAVIARAEGTSQ